jgi:hypothetical protein
MQKFLRPSFRSANMLAFWSYNSLISSGYSPYLSLHSTGWDIYGNMGSGFFQGRFQGKKPSYFKTRHRFGGDRVAAKDEQNHVNQPLY